jgi:hypothetical protein
MRKEFSDKKEKFKNVSLTLEPEVYSALKEKTSSGNLSNFANSIFKEYLKGERNKKLASEYASSQK